MATKRTSEKVITNVTEEEVTNAMAKYSSAKSKEAELTAKLEQELNKVRDKHKKDIDAAKADGEEQFKIIKAYATENKALFEKKKSIETLYGKYGFRTGNPAVKLVKGMKWEIATGLIKANLGEEYIRTVEEVNKEALLAKREDVALVGMLTKCGVTIDQDEKFFVEPKTEEVTAN